MAERWHQLAKKQPGCFLEEADAKRRADFSWQTGMHLQEFQGEVLLPFSDEIYENGLR